MAEQIYPGYEALDTFFNLMLEGLRADVDGDHFFNMMSDDIVWEFPYPLPQTPHEIVGRQKIIQSFSGYGKILFLDRMSGLIVHRVQNTLILEYATHGHAVQTGKPYNNRYITVLTLKNRKVINIRSYENPLPVLDALGSSDSIVAAMHRKEAH